MMSVCELLSKAYYDSVIPKNIIGGFRGSELWVKDECGPYQSRIEPSAYTTEASPDLLFLCTSPTRERSALV